MSTNATIAILTPKGAIRSITCHYDGNPEVAGDTLVNCFETTEKVNALIAKGNLRMLGSNLEKSEFYEEPFVKYADRKAWLDDADAEYAYFFDPATQEWEGYESDDGWCVLPAANESSDD